MIKKRLFSLAVIVICLSIAGAGTLAYFSDQTVAHNVITSGNIKIDLLEWQEDTDGLVPFENGLIVMPGTSASKIVQVENIGDNKAWIRIKVDKKITKADGTAGDADLLEINFNTTDWTQQGEYYYYNKPLEPKSVLERDKKVTAPLFETVTFDKQMGNDYQNSTAQVYVFAQATQWDNNHDNDNVLEVKGWPVIPENWPQD